MYTGDYYAVASALVWSFAVILMRVAGYQIPPVALTFFKSSVALFLLVITLFILQEPLLLDLSGWDYFRLLLVPWWAFLLPTPWWLRLSIDWVPACKR